MIVTGAGPGIMAAGMEGAGREQSIGVSIRLPWEQEANSVIAGDEKYVAMKYFFTRKLMLIKESKAFICLPGGFGTLDETFELLTLTQTGKGLPVPIVFLDTPGRHVLEARPGLHRGRAGDAGPRDPGRRRPLPRHRRLLDRRPRDPPLLRQLPLAALRRRAARASACARRPTTSSWPSSTGASATCAAAAGSSAASRSPSRSRSAMRWTSSASASPSPATASPSSGASSTP